MTLAEEAARPSRGFPAADRLTFGVVDYDTGQFLWVDAPTTFRLVSPGKKRPSVRQPHVAVCAPGRLDNALRLVTDAYFTDCRRLVEHDANRRRGDRIETQHVPAVAIQVDFDDRPEVAVGDRLDGDRCGLQFVYGYSIS